MTLPLATLFPYTTLFRSAARLAVRSPRDASPRPHGPCRATALDHRAVPPSRRRGRARTGRQGGAAGGGDRRHGAVECPARLRNRSALARAVRGGRRPRRGSHPARIHGGRLFAPRAGRSRDSGSHRGLRPRASESGAAGGRGIGQLPQAGPAYQGGPLRGGRHPRVLDRQPARRPPPWPPPAGTREATLREHRDRAARRADRAGGIAWHFHRSERPPAVAHSVAAYSGSWSPTNTVRPPSILRITSQSPLYALWS